MADPVVLRLSGGRYYHAIMLYEKNIDLLEINLGRANIDLITDDFKQNTNFWFDGRTVFPKRISKLNIYRSAERLDKKNKDEIESLEDCTREILDTPPSFHKKNSLDLKKEGLYIKGETYDPLNLLLQIISDADDNIIIIDGYINEDLLDLLKSKKTNVKVQILTFRVSAPLRVLSNAFNTQYGPLELRTSRDFHDRFLIIDDDEYYHFGASLKDLGKKGFMFSRIEETRIINFLKQEYQRIWTSATIII